MLILSLFGTAVQCYQLQTKISDSSFWMTLVHVLENGNCTAHGTQSLDKPSDRANINSIVGLT